MQIRLRLFHRLLGLSWALALIAGSASAQTPTVGLDQSKELTQYITRSWDASQGLPQNTVHGIAQTPNGYLWLATGEGLARFDGRQFTVFDPQTTPAFTVSEINALAVDQSGNLWVGTRGGGALRFDGETFMPFLEGAFVTSLAAHADGSIWIGTYGSGVARISGDRVETYGPDQGLEAEFVSTILSPGNGQLLFATELGVYTLREQRLELHSDEVLGSSFVSALFEDADGVLWIGVRDGRVIRREGNRDTVLIDSEEGAGYPSAFVEDDLGTIWISTSGGGVVRYRDGHIDRMTEETGLPSNDVIALYEDREGNLWIGTDGGGVVRLSDGKFTMYTDREGLGHNNVYSAYESADGSMWFGHNGGASQLIDGHMVNRSEDLGLAGADVLSIGADANAGLYFGTYDLGLFRLSETGVTHLTTEDGLPSDAIFAIHGDRQNRLWIGTDSGVAVHDGTTFKTYTSADGLPSDFITSIAEDRRGSIYIGTYDGGLSIFEGGSFRVVTSKDGLASDAVLSLYIDREDVVWVGTWGNGVSRIADGEVTSYATADGLFNDNVFVILEDDEANVWFTSNKGVSRVRKADFDNVDAGRKNKLSSTVYGADDGLWSVESNGGQQPAGWKSSDGRLWFPTVAGVASIDPAHMRLNGVEPPVVVERIIVDNSEIDTVGPVELAAGSDKIEIHYTALSLSAPSEVRFRYRLDGADEEWYDAKDRRQAFYTNLEPGQYNFRVIASNNDGVWNESGASLTFYLKPFFYQTTWFKALCLAAIAILLLLGYRWRVAQLRARQKYLEQVVDERTHDLRLEKEKVEESNRVISDQAEKLKELDRFKTRFFANISHEFRTPLTMIIGPLENALTGTYGSLGDGLRENVEKMLRNALRLMRLINQLLDLSKLESGKMQLRAHSRNVVPFLDGVLYSFTAFAETKNIKLAFESEADDVELFFEPDKFEKIFFNLLSNAAKFTPENGEIGIYVARTTADFGNGDREAVEIRVRDTGKGIPKKDLPHIFDRFHQVDGSNTREHEGTGIGLALVNELTLLHKGTIAVDSEMGSGTEFTLVFPAGREHLEEEQVVDNATTDSVDQHQGAMMELAAATLEFVDIRPPSGDTESRTIAPELVDAPLILVAEDNTDVREYIGDILGQYYRVALAEDGQAALERAKDIVPHLILSDVMMPRMDGTEFCRHVKEDPRLDHIPFVLLTARATHESKMEGLAAGADDYLSKPFNANELLARVANLLKIRDQERELKSFNELLSEKVEAQVRFILKQREGYERELIKERDKAQESARLKSSILNNVSHELRTPITTIVGYAQLLIPDMEGEQRDFLETIETGGRRLNEVLDAVLTLSELDARSSDIDDRQTPPRINVCSVATDVAFQHYVGAEQRGVHFEAAIPDAPIHVHAHKDDTHRVLSIILNNALKFTEPGGSVRMQISSDKEWVKVEIADTGVGIDTEYLPKLFEAFTQESEGLARSHDGVGLGLAIADRLVKLQGGTIDVQSEKGKGSSFTVSLPRNPPDTRKSATAGDREPIVRSIEPRRSPKSTGDRQADNQD